ncbi:MAG: hypothetical protein HWE26_09685 [Alteromonadaceae bacterium]|nr:hypothetical protein [Alteromonadaceae bacterium]
MKNLSENRQQILMLLVLAAAGSYFYGYNTGAITFIVIGGIFELAFWCGLLAPNDQADDSASQKAEE